MSDPAGSGCTTLLIEKKNMLTGPLKKTNYERKWPESLNLGQNSGTDKVPYFREMINQNA
jgi:hypothetical protein